MAIHLITDFGLEGPYTGQVLARLYDEAPDVAAFSLFADAPAFDARHGAYLVAAYGKGVKAGDVLLCVVDPGVGTERAGLVLNADGRWYVGPDNGLLAVAAMQAHQARWWRLSPPSSMGSQTFHGRDWFSPAAAHIAVQGEPKGLPVPESVVGLKTWPTDLAEIVYIDRYGNAMTGLRPSALTDQARLSIGGKPIAGGSVFAAAEPGSPFWYVNANGLVEIAMNRSRADQALGLRIGTPVGIGS